MNFNGIIIGAGAFLIIGLLHPVVIKAEYHLGKRCWPCFLAGGVAFVALSLFLPGDVLPAFSAVLGFSLLWSIRELFEQEQRVRRGWFPAHPHKKHHENLREQPDPPELLSPLEGEKTLD